MDPLDSTLIPWPPPDQCPAPERTLRVTRGVRRWLAALGQSSVAEFGLPGGRRMDVLAVDGRGLLTAVEIKVSIADLRGDRKWTAYEDFCDYFYFAVPEGFPVELVPDRCGLLVADAFDALLLRPAPERRLSPARRKAVLIDFCRVAASRLHRIEDGRLGAATEPF